MLTEADVRHFELDGESFVRPDFAGRGLANVAPTVLQLLASRASDQLELPPLDSDVLPDSLKTSVKTVVLVVADGLGHLQLQREIANGNAPNLGALVTRAQVDDPCVSYAPITSVFPTTTVAALGSVNSGVAPSHHGLLSYTVYLPEFNTVAELIRWGPLNRRISFSDPEFGLAPEEFFWSETMYARLQTAGVRRTFAVNPSGFAGTALTRMLHQHASYAGYIATSSLGPIVSRIVHESSEPTYVYAYWPTVDTISHIIGPLTPEHAAEVAAFDFQFGRLLESLRDRDDVLVLLTADHGHVDTDPSEAINFADHPELLAMLKATPAGERRAVYLHPKPGAVSDVFGYARQRLRDVAAAMLREDAVEEGLFGPGQLSERAAGRIGEVLLFPRGSLQLVPPIEYVDGTPPRAPLFHGLHGGLTPDEALVPLLAVRP
ncbi:MAG: alkaline phosphatase family protein [Chloroflexi bacterium]|nr:alkaline phosphatase family protein [Chloroflexota bacterium]